MVSPLTCAGRAPGSWNCAFGGAMSGPSTYALFLGAVALLWSVGPDIDQPWRFRAAQVLFDIVSMLLCVFGLRWMFTDVWKWWGSRRVRAAERNAHDLPPVATTEELKKSLAGTAVLRTNGGACPEDISVQRGGFQPLARWREPLRPRAANNESVNPVRPHRGPVRWAQAS